jgi:hypothetical protein
MNYSQIKIISRSCNAQAVSCCISPRSQGFAPGFLRKDFVVDKVTLVQVFLRVLRLSSVSVIPPWPSILIYHLGNEQQFSWWPQFRDSLTPSTRTTTKTWFKYLAVRLFLPCNTRLCQSVQYNSEYVLLIQRY